MHTFHTINTIVQHDLAKCLQIRYHENNCMLIFVLQWTSISKLHHEQDKYTADFFT